MRSVDDRDILRAARLLLHRDGPDLIEEHALARHGLFHDGTTGFAAHLLHEQIDARGVLLVIESGNLVRHREPH